MVVALAVASTFELDDESMCTRSCDTSEPIVTIALSGFWRLLQV